MKKFLTLTLLFVSAIIFVPSMEAKTTDSNANGAGDANYQRQNRNYQRRNQNRRVRIVNRTRTVRRGYRVYLEVYQYRVSSERQSSNQTHQPYARSLNGGNPRISKGAIHQAQNSTLFFCFF